jgi:hypothetical protein
MVQICGKISEHGSNSDIFSLKPLGLDTFSPNDRRMLCTPWRHSTSADVLSGKCLHIFEPSHEIHESHEAFILCILGALRGLR